MKKKGTQINLSIIVEFKKVKTFYIRTELNFNIFTKEVI